MDDLVNEGTNRINQAIDVISEDADDLRPNLGRRRVPDGRLSGDSHCLEMRVTAHE
jgi:hypothetical protein